MRSTFTVRAVPWPSAVSSLEASSLDEARSRHRTSLAELPRAVTMMSAGEPVIPTVFER